MDRTAVLPPRGPEKLSRAMAMASRAMAMAAAAEARKDKKQGRRDDGLPSNAPSKRCRPALAAAGSGLDGGEDDTRADAAAGALPAPRPAPARPVGRRQRRRRRPRLRRRRNIAIQARNRDRVISHCLPRFLLPVSRFDHDIPDCDCRPASMRRRWPDYPIDTGAGGGGDGGICRGSGGGDTP